MSLDSEKRPEPPVPPDSQGEGSGDERQRIRVTGSDPWTPRPRPPTKPRERRRSRATYAPNPRELQRGKTKRKQSSLLGALFAILAFIIYLGTQVMAPTFIVHLDGGEGNVLVDGVVTGRTGEVLRVTPGEHELVIAPDDYDVIADPQSFHLNFKYSVKTIPIHVQIIRQENVKSPEPSSTIPDTSSGMP